MNTLFMGCGGSGGGVYEIDTPKAPPLGIVLSSPALSHNRIFIGSPEGFLYALDAAGNSLWNFDTTASINSSPAVSNDGSIYFGSNNGTIYSLDQQGGRLWTYTTNGAVHSSPAIDHLGRIWIGSDDGHLYSFQSNGDTHFSTNTGAGIRTNPAVYGDAAVFVGNNAGTVISYDLNGQQRYSFTSGTAAVTAGPVVDSLANVYYGTYDGRMISLDKDGNFRWSFQAGNAAIYSSPAIDEQKNLFFGSDDHNLYALDQNGSELWRYDTGAAVRSSPALFAESSIIVGITNQTMLHLNTQGSAINTFATSSPIHSSPLIVNNNGVYVGHGGKEIHKIDATQISQSAASVQASQLPWSKYRGAVNNPGRVECTTTAQILADFGEFGPANSWEESPITGQLQSTANDPSNFSGIRSNINLTTYSLEANLYATTATSGQTHDNDVIALIAAATIDQDDTLHLIVAQRGGEGDDGQGRRNGHIQSLHWGFVHVQIEVDINSVNFGNTTSREVIWNGNNSLITPQGYWSCDENPGPNKYCTPNSGFPGGSTVRIEKTADGVSAFASPLHAVTPQPIRTDSRIHVNWDENPEYEIFRGPTSYGFAAVSQAMASFRNININGVEGCTIEP